MPEYDTADLRVCTDCALIIANGTDDDPDKRDHLITMAEHTADWSGHIVIGEEDGFSNLSCDTCGTDLAGDRWTATLLTPTGASPSTSTEG